MTKVLQLIIVFLLINYSLTAQTKQQLISKDLLNAISALNNKDYVTSINYLDRCQQILGDEIIPRIEELYISNFKALENPILLDEHLRKYLDVASKNRKGYQNYLKESSMNTSKLGLLLIQLKEESKKTQYVYSSYYSPDELPVNEIILSTFITKPGELEGNGKIKVFSDDVKLINISDSHPANKYYYDTINDLAFSKIGYASHSFSSGLALVDKIFIDKTGKSVLNFEEYDQVNYFIKGVALLKKNGKWGVVNKEGEIIIPVEYDNILSVLKLNILKVEKDNKYGFYNFKGKQLTPLHYDKENNNINEGFGASIWFTNENFEGNIYPVKLNDKYGFINSKGETVIDYQFENKSVFKNGLIGLKKNDKWGVIDTLNTEIIPFKYYDLFIQKNIIGAIDKVKDDILISFFKPSGDLVLPPEYSLVSYNEFDKKTFKNGNGIYVSKTKSIEYSIGYIKDSILLKKNKKYYFFDINTLRIKQAPFDKVQVLKTRILKVKLEERYGIYDFLGYQRLPIEFDELELVGKGNTIDNQIYFSFKKGNDSGIININTKEITTLSFKVKEVLQKNLFLVENEGKLGIVNSKNEIVLPFKYSDIESINMNFFKVEKNNLKGIINGKGEIIQPVEISEMVEAEQYNGIDNGKNKYYYITKNSKIGLVDNSGNLIIATEYDKLEFYSRKEIFYFEKGDKVGYLDKTGEAFLESKYKILEAISDRCLIARNKQNKVGIIDANEIIKVPFKYDLIEPIKEDTFSVLKDHKFGVVNLNNSIVIPLIYDFFSAVYYNPNLLIVRKNNKMGIINLLNNELLPLKYDMVEPTITQNSFKTKLNGVWQIVKI